MSRPSQPDEVFDEGLQQERTALAWDRTGMSMMVAGVMLLKNPSSLLPLLPILVGAAVVISGAWLSLVSHLRYRKLHRVLRAEQPVPSPWLVRWVSLSTVALAIMAIVDLASM